jgi:hypothetical protein
MKTIEERLASIEAFISARSQKETHDMSSEARQRAQSMATFSVITELVQKAGISFEDFSENYEERVQFFHDKLLNAAENISRRRSAEIDDRNNDEVSVASRIRPLFPNHS